MPLEEVKVEVTSMCNLDCEFCYNQDMTIDPSLSQITSVLDKIRAAGCRAVRITGGEPLMRKDLVSILKRAKDVGLKVILNTNGSLINDQNVHYFVYVDQVILSCHDSSQLKRKGDIIKDLARFGPRVHCCTVLTKHNIVVLEEFFRFFSSQKADWFLLRPVPSNAEMPMTKEDLATAVKLIMDLNDKYHMKASINNAVPFCASPDVEKVCVGGRNDNGYAKLTVDCSGNIKPDNFGEYYLGNIAVDDILGCWDSEKLRVYRDTVDPRCSRCNLYRRCLGGLRHASRISGHLMDPLGQ